jgi:predicted nucleotidyltransferase
MIASGKRVERNNDPEPAGRTMTNTSIDEQAITDAIAVLQRREMVAAAYLLGSAAHDRLRGDSDVDIAMLLSHGACLSSDERMALTAELATTFGRPVDLGVLSTRNVVYGKEAVVTGRLLFARHPNVAAEFAMLTLSMYASLQESRREVLRAYAA